MSRKAFYFAVTFSAAALKEAPPQPSHYSHEEGDSNAFKHTQVNLILLKTVFQLHSVQPPD